MRKPAGYFRISLLIFVGLLVRTDVLSREIVAASLSRADIQAAVNSALPGDIVVLPAGSTSSFSGCVLITTDSIHIRGQGPASTYIRTPSPQNDQPMFRFSGTTGCKFSGVKLEQYNSQSGYETLLLLENSTYFEVFNCAFSKSSLYSVGVVGQPVVGVIHDCVFSHGCRPGLGYGVLVEGTAPGELDNDRGDASWNAPLALGTIDGVYIEDCSFSDYRHYVASNRGARYIVRHCSIAANASCAENDVFDTHGYAGEGRGVRKVELYNNVVDFSGPGGNLWLQNRDSGDGVVFNNTCINMDRLENFFYFTLPCCPQEYDCGPYPYQDQPRAVYFWNNIVNGQSYNSAAQAMQCDDESGSPYFVQGRDWFDSPMPGYSPLAYPHPLRSNTLPIIAVSPGSLAFSSGFGASNPPSQTLEVYNAGGGVLSWSISDNEGWLSCSPVSGQGYGTVRVSAASAGLNPGVYKAIITVLAPGAANSPERVSVKLTVYSGTSELVITSSTGAPATGEGGTTDPPPGAYSYPRGSYVSLDALANPGYRFSRWNGDVSPEDAFKAGISLPLDRDKSLEADFCGRCGDVNGDLEITPGDAQRVFDIYLGVISGPTRCELENADVNGDGTKTEPKITPADAQALFNYYLGTSPLPGNCSGASRAGSALSTPSPMYGFEKDALGCLEEEIPIVPDRDVIVQVIVEDPMGLTAFGFDLHFSENAMHYVSYDKTEFIEGLDNMGVHRLADGLLRIGGFRSRPLMDRSPVVIPLVFRAVGRGDPFSPIRISNAVDDLERSELSVAFFQENSSSEKVLRERRVKKDRKKNPAKEP